MPELPQRAAKLKSLRVLTCWAHLLGSGKTHFCPRRIATIPQSANRLLVLFPEPLLVRLAEKVRVLYLVTAARKNAGRHRLESSIGYLSKAPGTKSGKTREL